MKVSEAFSVDDGFERLKRHTAAWFENRESVAWIIRGIETEDWLMAKEAWDELSNETKTDLYLSRRAGGLWSPKEYKALHSNEFFHGLDDD